MLPQDFTTRPATPDDVDAIVDLLNACAIAQTGKPEVKASQLRTDWGRVSFNFDSDTLLVLAPQGQLAGYAEMWDEPPHVRISVVAEVHPAHQGRGVGTALCRWAEKRARQSVPKAPQGARVTLGQFKLSANEATRALLYAQGYQIARYNLRMMIELNGMPPQPVVPAGLTIRSFVRGQEERALVQAIREAFLDHWGYVERPFEEDFQDWMHFLDSPDTDPALWFVAVDGAEIAGTAFGYTAMVEDPELGWVYGLGVRRPWRRRGVALALLHHCFGDLYRRGKRRVGLGVDAQSLTGATRLYEKAGMHVDAKHQYAEYEKELRPGRELATQSVAD
jgi:mycothiol synthase